MAFVLEFLFYFAEIFFFFWWGWGGVCVNMWPVTAVQMIDYKVWYKYPSPHPRYSSAEICRERERDSSAH